MDPVGLEPTCPEGPRILSPLRLPIPPQVRVRCPRDHRATSRVCAVGLLKMAAEFVSHRTEDLVRVIGLAS